MALDIPSNSQILDGKTSTWPVNKLLQDSLSQSPVPSSHFCPLSSLKVCGQADLIKRLGVPLNPVLFLEKQVLGARNAFNQQYLMHQLPAFLASADMVTLIHVTVSLRFSYREVPQMEKLT